MLAWITSALCAVNELHSTTLWRPSNSGGVSPPGCSRTRPLVSPSPKQLESRGTPATRPAPRSCRRDGAASRAERRRGREVCMTLLRGDGAGPQSAAAAGGGAGESGDDVALGEEEDQQHRQ